MGHSAFPLEWPPGKKQRDQWSRERSRFKDLGFGKTRDDLLRACTRMGGSDVTLSTMVPLRRDGLPYANVASPSNPGVALYFSLPIGKHNAKRRHYALCCDLYRSVPENMRALVHTLDAMAAIRRHGSSDLLEQAMSGFAALPPTAEENWWSVLVVRQDCSLEEAKAAYRQLVQQAHPDRGGSDERMARLNLAFAAAERELGGA